MVEFHTHYYAYMLCMLTNQLIYNTRAFCILYSYYGCSKLVKDNPGRVNAHLNTRVKRVLFAKDHKAIGIELANGSQVFGDRVVLAGGVL